MRSRLWGNDDQLGGGKRSNLIFLALTHKEHIRTEEITLF